jgi:hypothetical protein
MTELQTYTTVNSTSKIIVSMGALSHVIEHDNKDREDKSGNPISTCWLHFHSGKSVHVDTSFSDVSSDIEDYYATRV